MKNFFTLLLLLPFLAIFAQGSESFDNASLTTSYADGSFVGNNGITWSYTHSRDESTFGINGKGIMLRRPDEPSSLSATFSGGIGNLSLDVKKAFTGNSPRLIEVLINGVPVDTLEPTFIAGADPSTYPLVVNNINVSGTINFELKSVGANGNAQIVLDNIVWTGFTGAPITDTIVSFLNSSASIFDNAGTYNLNVALNTSFTGADKTVDVVLTNGNGAIVDGFTTQTVTFTAGGALTQVLALDIISGLISGSEVLTFELQNTSAGLILDSNNEFALTINETVPLPLYSIATVRGANTDGGPDSLNVVCDVVGTVLGVNFGTGQQLSFFINDGTAGMGVFIPAAANTFGYTVQEGDSLRISGRVAVFNGLAQMDNITAITVLGTGNVPTPQVVTSLSEATEGELVTLENVTILNQSDWGNGLGTGTGTGRYDVKVLSSANDTLLVVIDGDTELFGTTLPGCELNITGIGTQFKQTTPNNTPPFVGGYRLQPRFNSDVTVIDTCPPPSLTTIFDIQFTTDASGNSPLSGQTVSTSGIVSAVRPGGTGSNVKGFYIQDGDGPWNGIFVFNNSFEVEEGDSIVLTGSVTESFNQTELEFVSNLTILASGKPVLVTEVSTNDVNTEAYEGVLVKVVNANCNNPSAGFGQFQVNDGSGNCLVDDDIYQYPNPALNVRYNITGPVRYSFSEFKIEPRRSSDVEISTTSSINTLELAQLNVYPNPTTSGVVTISFENNKNEVMNIDIFDVTGKFVKTIETNLTTGVNNIEVNLSNLETGYYFVALQTTEGLFTTKVLKK